MINDPAHALAEALKLATLGIPVFPVRLCKDACLRCDICKTPSCWNGFYGAETDPAKVRALWRRYPGALVGVPTGKASGFDLLDIDSAKHNEAAVWYFSKKSMIPHTRVHISGSGGLHILFRRHSAALNTRSRIETGIDTKADRGYLVWWPAAGKKIVHDVPLAEWPPWLIKAQQPPLMPVREFHRGSGEGAKSLEHLANFVAGLPEGQRNSGTFWGFCRAFEAVAQGGVSETDAVYAISTAALRTGLPETEIRAIARSAKFRSRGIKRHA
jgi:hypothetical protein